MRDDVVHLPGDPHAFLLGGLLLTQLLFAQHVLDPLLGRGEVFPVAAGGKPDCPGQRHRHQHGEHVRIALVVRRDGGQSG